jgi:hypothetical protein
VVAAVICTRGLPQRLGNPGIEKKAAGLVDQLVGPGRRILVFNETPAIYYLSHSESVGPYVTPSFYLRSCPTSVEMPLSGDYITRSLRAHPDLILSGSMCSAESDSDGLFRRSGYMLIGKASDRGREIDVYAPSGACMAASPHPLVAEATSTASCPATSRTVVSRRAKVSP